MLIRTETFRRKGGIAPGSSTKAVAAGDDDGFEVIATGAVHLADAEISCHAARVMGMRFINMGIPAGATISAAELRLTANASNTTAAAFDLYGEKAANAAAFTTTTGNLTGRLLTTAIVAWNPTPSFVGGTQYITPDLSAVLQEIVAAGATDTIVLFMRGQAGTATRRIAPFENIGAHLPPVLHVAWSG